MKNKFSKLSKILALIIIAIFLNNCASNKDIKKEDRKLPKEALDCCPGGGGILDYNFHYDAVHFTDSTREGNPYVVFNVGGRDILYFSSARKIEDHKAVSKQGDLFYSTRPSADRFECWNKNWSEPKEIKTGDADFDKWTKGTLTIFKNKAIISSENSLNKETPNKTLGTGFNLDLWELDYSEGNFANPKALPENVNSPFWDTYPTFSPDGSVLYFVSNMPLDKKSKVAGDFNIWVSKRNGNTWSDAIPLSSINTSANEVTPFWGTDGKFYFASDKNGNYDIFVCTESELKEGISFPKNPQDINDYLKNDRNTKEKYEINTPNNELNPFVTPDCSGLFYASDKVGKSRDYDLYACKLPPPLFRLKVNVYESISLCGQKERRSYEELVLCIDDGKETKKFQAKEILNLEPNRYYVVTICDENYAQCYNKNVITDKKIEINTATFCDKNKLFEETIEIESAPVTDNFSVGADNFVTGYWKPSTTENIEELKRKGEEGFFENKKYPANFVRYNDPPDNTAMVDKSFMDITSKISSYINRYYNCLKSGIYQLRINIKGFTDRQRIRGGSYYPDETFSNVTRKWEVTQGTAMKDIQRGNIILSKMRAYHTFVTIEKMMSTNQKYKELKEKIIYDFEGMGVDFNAYRGTCSKDDCPQARKMEVTIDLGPECWLDQNRRIPEKVSYLPLYDKDEKGKVSTEASNYALIQKFDLKEFPKKECDEFHTEYSFSSKKDAEFVLNVINQFSDVKFQIEPKKKASGEEFFVLKTNDIKNIKADALNDLNKSISALSEAASLLKKSSPNLIADGCQEYIISFGVFVSNDLAVDFIEKLDELEINNLKIRECEDCIQSKNYSSGEDEFIKSFLVYAPGFESRESAEKQMQKWNILLDRYEILNYMRVEKEIWNYKK